MVLEFIILNQYERVNPMRQDIPFNYDWFYAPDFKEDYLNHKNDDPSFSLISLPHTNIELPYNNFSEKAYQFVSSYRKIFDVPLEAKGNSIFLHFSGVMTNATVYVNQTLIKIHEGGYTPFWVDITQHIHFDKQNELFVKVDSREIKDIPPFGNVVDYLTYGGIYREVTLEIRPEVHIKHLLVKTYDSIVGLETDMLLDYTVMLSKEFKEECEIEAVLFFQGEKILSDQFVETSSDLSFHRQALVQGIHRWDLDNPHLYQLTVTIKANHEVIDSISTRFGFRTLAFTDEGFVINNKKTKLIGLNRHQSYPYVGYAMPKRIQEKDADILKYELGCNIVRTSHYMQSDHFINRCDEVGLLVFEEIPGWQYIGNEHFKELTLSNLGTMILHHYNHPSICIWGVRINESPDDSSFYKKTNELAHQLDDSRMTGGVRNFAGSEMLEDVYTYNDFSHTGNNQGLARPRKITKQLMPYLVTEYNGHMFPTKKYDDESKRLEHALRHLQVQDYNFKFENLSGAIGWCMTDYNTHVEFGSGDRICYHGVMDMFRIPKYAASVYASQQTKNTVLTVASNMAVGEYPASNLPQTVIFTNCDYVKVYRNGDYIDTFYSSWDDYQHVLFAPIVIDDYIGQMIHKNEKYSPRVASRIKKVLLAYNKYGPTLTLKDRLRMAHLMVFNHFKMTDAIRIYGEYIGNWGHKGGKYVYEGYVNDTLVKTVTKGGNEEVKLIANLDDTSLKHGDTYDATRIVLKLVDEYENDLVYGNNAFIVETGKELELIGPRFQSLIGGSIGIYVKTTGLLGKSFVKIKSEGFPDIKLTINVQ
jgi:beta-galactosidase